MTDFILKDATIESVYNDGENRIFTIVLSCPMSDVKGEICEVYHLDVEIKSKENGHRD